ncbi:hemerythrin domain-containing protein [Spirillospora sp. NPDC047279]|uniref:hemerythrin domain-containing protein n=1 Tax=Spirillospora sp. NPDC047279 TaxID=3155478 RepID=UPI0033C8BFDB
MAEKDLVMMLAAHDAFRRDLRLLSERFDPERWASFRAQLSTHHRAEDAVLWPRLRKRGVDPGLVDAMEAEHSTIDPLLRAVDGGRRDEVATLRDVLGAHLRHEETDVLPQVDEDEWRVLDREFRRRLGVRGIRSYFAWVLEGASDEMRAKVLKAAPAPVRLVIR